ncbi:MAG: UDP-N-acetylglucosamine--N-acetylmuramyl-(pentapeptide) pyrophosphoryl-undecaprenol N-acetylglucosamine transferase [Planctomycetia bacterium]
MSGDDLPARPARAAWLAGGGTVGHLAPGFAIASALAARGQGALFVTPGEAREAGWFPPGSPPVAHLPAPRRPRSLGEALRFLPRMAAAVGRGVRRLHRERPPAVLALGGWPCVPAALAALASGTPLALLASDLVPGVVVRALAPLARRCYVAHPEAGRRLRGGTVQVTGPVLRPALAGAVRDPARLGLREGRLTLLVVGGSLGARALNEALVRGVAEAAAADPSLRERLQVLHSVGGAGEGVEAGWQAAGVPARVVPFIQDMGTAYRTADLVVSRAGAITCAELEALGVPAVLVPYPHHEDRQQHLNAGRLAARGGALLLEEHALTPQAVREQVLGLLLDGGRRAAMAAAMRREAGDAAGAIAHDLLHLRRARRR